MSKIKPGVKSKLIWEVLITAYFFGASLANKFINKGNATGLTPIIIWLIICGFHYFYENKYNDIVDEASKHILSKVNEIAMKMIFYSIIIVAIFFVTPYAKNVIISNLDTGIILLVILFIQALLKLGLFIYFNRKGIYN